MDCFAFSTEGDESRIACERLRISRATLYKLAIVKLTFVSADEGLLTVTKRLGVPTENPNLHA